MVVGVCTWQRHSQKETAVCITLLGTEPRAIGEIPLFLDIASSNVSASKKKKKNLPSADLKCQHISDLILILPISRVLTTVVISSLPSEQSAANSPVCEVWDGVLLSYNRQK